jgi:GT2 family glycosyltransferase
MKKNFVSIIIVNWNGLEHLKDCIESLEKITYKNIEIVVSDNGSKDGSVEYIKTLQKKKKNIFLIESENNLGFAEGNNAGVAKANGDLILFLNNDAIVEKHFLEPLIKKINSDKNIAAVQPKILCYPQKEIIDSVGSYFLNTGFLYHYGHNKKDQEKYNHEDEIFSMKGACMLFRKEVLDIIGVFNRSYFAYFEETDLCHRTWLAGYKILYIPTSEIYHKGGQTAKRLSSAFLEYHSNKNRLYTYLKNFEVSYLVKIIPLHILFLEIAAIVYIVLLKFSLALTIQKAIWWNIYNWRTLISDRKELKKIKKVSNNFFLPKLTKKVRLSYYYHLLTTALADYEDYV